MRLVRAGDSVVIVEFEDRIDPVINARAVAVAARMLQAADAVRGVRDIVPTFRSVAVYFDPLRTDYDALSLRLQQAAERSATGEDSLVPTRDPTRRTDPIRVPVCYGGTFGPDLGDVAAFAGVGEDEAAELHAGRLYRVFMLGFVPGFAYMGSVDPRIAAPRRAVPRARVPAGSVGIAGEQTGVYPSESPGGWQLIGRTPLRPFDAERSQPALFAAGDSVQFYRIDAADFQL